MVPYMIFMSLNRFESSKDMFSVFSDKIYIPALCIISFIVTILVLRQINIICRVKTIYVESSSLITKLNSFKKSLSTRLLVPLLIIFSRTLSLMNNSNSIFTIYNKLIIIRYSSNNIKMFSDEILNNTYLPSTV